ncbi:leucine-rich repeat flightless-interacting protein 1 isoform X8 [Cavia porcellus]|uniref:leucine-rich repeat flightless-interacting protein 1 isoform X8 n=1 Tax=Cavia porcellus TaxID=10141 RepID=UPI002FDF2F28
MGSQGAGRRRLPQRERLTAEDDTLSQIAREAEARLAAKRAARAEAREIRMKELERQQKEIYQVQKKYYGLDTKWGDIEQWMEDSERYSRRSRRLASASDEDERLSVGSRGSLRSQPDLESGGPYAWSNGYDGELYGSQAPSRRSGRNSGYSGDGRFSTLSSPREEKLPLYLCGAVRPAGSYRASVFQESSIDWARRGSADQAQRGSACGSLAPSEYSGHLNSGSRASSRASSARASPVVEERPEKDFTEKGSRNMPSLSAATLASLGGTSSRRGSGDTSISMDTEASMREIKELNELKDQIQDVEGKYMQGLKELKDSLAEVEEKYKKAMVSNAQLDNEKTNFMYQVDTLKDALLELEEELAEARRQCEEKSKEFERERHAHSVLQFQFAEVKEALRQRDEMLEKHGIILNSEVATNGETSDTLNNVGSPGPTKMSKEEINALKSASDGTLGRAKEVEVENEIVENVGKTEILQNAEHRQHKKDPVQNGVGVEVSDPAENAEGQRGSEDLANAGFEEQVQSQHPEDCETLGQTGSQEVTVISAEGTGASLGQPKCPENLGSGASSPLEGQDTCNASDVIEQSEQSVGRQDQENQGLKTEVEETHPKPCQGSTPVQGPEAEWVSGADPRGPGEGHIEEELETGGAAVGAPESHPGTHPVNELGTSMGHSSEKELTKQDAAEAGEASAQSAEVGRENNMEEEGDAGTKDEKPVQTDAQTIPEAPAAKDNQEEVLSPGRADPDHEPSEVKNTQQTESLDSSQKKSKNKKKKNKKKKSSAPVESLEDVRKELTYQDADGGMAQGEPGQFAGEKPAEEAQEEVSENAAQKILAGGVEPADCPEWDGKLNQEDDDMNPGRGSEGAARDAVDLAGGAVQPSGTDASEKESAESVTDGSVDLAGVTSEAENADGTSSSLLQNESPSGTTENACQTGSPEMCVTHEQQNQMVQEAAGSISLEKGDLSGPTEELGGLDSESKSHEKGGNEKGKGKEDCTMS